jgi:hypothetical protein
MHSTKAYARVKNVWLHPFFNIGVSRQLHAPTAYPQYPLNRRLDKPRVVDDLEK